MIGERIKKAREEAGLSQEELSKRLKIGKRTLIDYEKGVSEPKPSTLLKIAEICNTDAGWLLTGKSNLNIQTNKVKHAQNVGMNIKNYNNHSVVGTKQKDFQIQSSQPQVFDEENGIEVTYYPDVYAAAGYGATNTLIEPKKVKLAEFILDFFGIRDYKKAVISNVLGDSMEPVFQNGDLAIVERVSSFDEVKNGDTIIINIDGDVYVKKIEKIPFENKIILKSNNPLYKDTIIDLDETNNIKIVAVVKGKFRLI